MDYQDQMVNGHMFLRKYKAGGFDFGELRDRAVSQPGPVSASRVLEIKMQLVDDELDCVDMTDDEFFAVFGEQRAGDTRRLAGIEYDALGCVVTPWERLS